MGRVAFGSNRAAGQEIDTPIASSQKRDAWVPVRKFLGRSWGRTVIMRYSRLGDKSKGNQTF